MLSKKEKMEKGVLLVTILTGIVMVTLIIQKRFDFVLVVVVLAFIADVIMLLTQKYNS